MRRRLALALAASLACARCATFEPRVGPLRDAAPAACEADEYADAGAPSSCDEPDAGGD